MFAALLQHRPNPDPAPEIRRATRPSTGSGKSAGAPRPDAGESHRGPDPATTRAHPGIRRRPRALAGRCGHHPSHPGGGRGGECHPARARPHNPRQAGLEIRYNGVAEEAQMADSIVLKEAVTLSSQANLGEEIVRLNSARAPNFRCCRSSRPPGSSRTTTDGCSTSGRRLRPRPEQLSERLTQPVRIHRLLEQHAVQALEPAALDHVVVVVVEAGHQGHR